MAAKKKNPPKTPPAKTRTTPQSARTAAARPAAAGAPPQAAPPPPSGHQAKLSALEAAARVLGETGQALTCPALIRAMAAQGYWTSPAGKTPHATLYAAIWREIQTKKDQARFRKTGRGKFALA
jgi:hypothetical protein